MNKHLSLKAKKILCALALSAVCLPSFGWASEDANALVARADAVRVPDGSYEFSAVVTSFEGDRKKAENGYKVFVKDLEHTLIAFRSPASEKGKSLLMLGDDLWLYLPNVGKPVRLPLQQRLVGDVANGDMARANLAHDYEAARLGDETVDGKPAVVLDLTAKSDGKTYKKIKYWISKTDNRPLKTEYFTVSGQSLKTCSFEDFREAAGALRPMSLVFRDSLRPEKRSVLTLSDMTRKKLSDDLFTKDYMKTLE